MISAEERFKKDYPHIPGEPDITLPSRRYIAILDALEAAEARADTERAIVDRVWKALGIATYEQAGGKAIDEHVADLRDEVERFREAAEAAREALDYLMGDTDTVEDDSLEMIAMQKLSKVLNPPVPATKEGER